MIKTFRKLDEGEDDAQTSFRWGKYKLRHDIEEGVDYFLVNQKTW